MLPRILLMLAAGFVAALLACGGDGDDRAATAFPDSLVSDELLVSVNNFPVRGRDLQMYLGMYMPAGMDSVNDRRFNLQLLEGFIDRVLLWQDAKGAGVTIDDSTASWFMREFVSSVGGMEALSEMLYAAGVTPKDVERNIKRDLAIRAYLEQTLLPRVQLTEEDVRAYYDANEASFVSVDSVHARHILLSARSGAPDSLKASQREKLGEIRARIVAGADFIELCKEYSEGPSAPNGGDLGYFAREEMVAPFSDAAFALEVGELSEIVETPFGYHLIRVEDRVAPRKLTYEEARQSIITQLRRQLMENALENHLNQSRAIAIIEPHYGG